MAPNTLSPASVVIDYHGPFGAHKMTIPTKPWFPTNITGNLGSYEAWNLSTVDAETMVRALVDTLKEFMQPSAQFDGATVYTQASPTAPNIPQRTVALAVVGTSTNVGNPEAVSATWNFKTTGNGSAKLILLDTPIRSTWFAKILPASFDSPQDAVVSAFTGDAYAWSGRDDLRPSVCRSITYDLNDKLQRQYFK